MIARRTAWVMGGAFRCDQRVVPPERKDVQVLRSLTARALIRCSRIGLASVLDTSRASTPRLRIATRQHLRWPESRIEVNRVMAHQTKAARSYSRSRTAESQIGVSRLLIRVSDGRIQTLEPNCAPFPLMRLLLFCKGWNSPPPVPYLNHAALKRSAKSRSILKMTWGGIVSWKNKESHKDRSGASCRSRPFWDDRGLLQIAQPMGDSSRGGSVL